MDPLDDYDLVIFDCDGVVVDSELLSCSCLADTFREHDVALDVGQVLELFVGRSITAVEAYWRTELLRDLPIDFFPVYRRRVMTAFTQKLQAMPLAGDVLARLPRPYCLASSSEIERIRLTLSVTRLDSYFKGRIFSSAMVARGKPAPDLFLHAAREMRFAPERALVIEDSIAGVHAGKAASMTVWGFIGGSHCQGRDAAARLTAAGADRIFDSLGELLPQ
jgi:HAD superfamily hydrolase (TIGR01509 family)